jgi:hypothetical protein
MKLKDDHTYAPWFSSFLTRHNPRLIIVLLLLDVEYVEIGKRSVSHHVSGFWQQQKLRSRPQEKSLVLRPRSNPLSPGLNFHLRSPQDATRYLFELAAPPASVVATASSLAE